MSGAPYVATYIDVDNDASQKEGKEEEMLTSHAGDSSVFLGDGGASLQTVFPLRKFDAPSGKQGRVE